MELLLLLLLKIIITIALLGLLTKLMQMCEALIWKPKRLRSILRKQGIRGPPELIEALVSKIPQLTNILSGIPQLLHSNKFS
jgi:hypothetical protein